MNVSNDISVRQSAGGFADVPNFLATDTPRNEKKPPGESPEGLEIHRSSQVEETPLPPPRQSLPSMAPIGGGELS